MISLEQDLQQVKQNIDQFGEITHRILQYLPIIISKSVIKNDYIIHSSQSAGTLKYVRPINTKLFLKDSNAFEESFVKLKHIFEKIKTDSDINQSEKDCIDK